MAEPSPKRRRTSAEPPIISETGDFRPRNALRRTPPRRASWLSPTKASRARFNPEILSRRTSAVSAAGEPAEPSGSPSRGQRALAYVLGESQQNPDRPEGDAAAAAAQDGGERRHSIGGRLLPSRNVLQAAAADQLAQESAQAERRASAEDDLPTYPTGSPAARPDLPPEQGLSSSPSKRPRRNKSLGQRLSSPFKPRESPLRPEPAERDTEASANDSTPSRENLAREEGRQLRESIQAAGSVAVEDKPASAVPMKVEIDPKEKEKDLLQKQLKEMQEEIKLYEREVKRSRTAPGDGDEDIDALVSLINKADPSPPVLKPEVPPLSSLLSAFLPLAKPVRPPTPSREEPEKPLPSHKPIELNDPLPYVRLFTAFKYNSKIDVDEESWHQIHSISMRSPGSLLCLDLKLFANPATQTVSKLDVASLSPWASHELGAWIKLRAAENDVSAVCWATESYYDLATKRAKCWAHCYRQFARFLDNVLPEQKEKAGSKIAAQREGAQNEVPTSSNLLEEDAEEVSGIGNELTAGDQEERPISRSELLHGLGRESIVIRSRQVSFKVSWKIRFDWTGEAESVVAADVALPSVWREADDRGSLRKVSATFDKLIAEMGVLDATRTMANLLFRE